MVDGRNKESYSVGCPWRSYYAGDIRKKGEKHFVFDYYSKKKYLRGEELEISCSEKELSNSVLALALCEILGVEIYSVCRRVEEFYNKNVI